MTKLTLSLTAVALAFLDAAAIASTPAAWLGLPSLLLASFGFVLYAAASMQNLV